jgi:Fe-S-cluster-containing dehydrogenase component/formate-dependent nitrite reductase membrane component NrfD
MRYGFVIDQDRCIGCHACTVACKEEHGVPLGVFRTWVKYIEKGEYPYTRRHFGVMRCNHCDSAPCSTICPTNALYRRADGIIDFDNQKCIGCKSCMQACPYDALYIDPASNTAAKCNFCAHRIEANLEPACVIVCPTQAILTGDLDDAASKVSRIVATEKVSVRKPHKGTEPKLFYVGIEGDLLDPTRLSRQSGYAFADRHDGRSAEPDFDPSLTREVYDVAHAAPWGWRIAAYLWTKSIAAGVMLVAALMLLLAGRFEGVITNVVSPTIALAALGVTALLLIFDLKRPDRFYYLLTKPNFHSWLVIGAYILMVYGGLCLSWLILGLRHGMVPALLVVATATMAAASAGYSAFLFAQAKGRDLWQSPAFFWHLLIRAFTAGSAVWLIMNLYYHSYAIAQLDVLRARMSLAAISRCLFLLMFLMLVTLCMTLTELALPHVSQDAELAAHNVLRGSLKGRFWGLAIGCGLLLPLVLLGCVLVLRLPWRVDSGLLAAAAVLALAGVAFFEDLWVRAGQSVPLS